MNRKGSAKRKYPSNPAQRKVDVAAYNNFRHIPLPPNASAQDNVKRLELAVHLMSALTEAAKAFPELKCTVKPNRNGNIDCDTFDTVINEAGQGFELPVIIGHDRSDYTQWVVSEFIATLCSLRLKRRYIEFSVTTDKQVITEE